MKMVRMAKAAWRSLGAHRLRAALAAVGVTVGVAAVVAVVSIGEGTKAEVLRTIESLGSNLIVVTVGQTATSAGRQQSAADVITLIPEDATALAEEVDNVRYAVPAQTKKLDVTWETNTTTTSVVATLPDYQEVRNFHAARGDFFDEDMVKHAARVAVLGQTVVDNLFGHDDPLDATVRVGGAPFTVIGVMEKKGLDVSGQDQDDQVFIPLTTGLRRLFNLTNINAIFIQATRPEAMQAVAANARAVLRERHKLREGADDDFVVQNQSELVAARQETSSSLTLLLGSIGGISLLVGGVGILAVMLVSVKERTREIGVRRAVGATRRDLLMQFLVEAATLSLTGSVVGVALGTLAAAVTARFTQWGMAFSLPVTLGAVAFSVGIGVIFGLYPARRAALLNPIQALRGE
jgi:putative ABC transport system permease protein